MFRNLGIGGGVLLLLLVFLPEITAVLAKQGLKQPNKEWAPPLVRTAANINRGFWRYGAAAGMYQAALKTWPQVEWAGDAWYNLALCYEKGERHTEAVTTYDYFMTQYPTHRWKDQAAKRKSLIQAQHGMGP